MSRAAEEYRDSAERVVQMLESADIPTRTREAVLSVLRRSVDRLGSGNPPSDRNPVHTMTRLLVDGNGPRDPEDPLCNALNRLSDLHEQVMSDAPLRPLPRSAVRGLGGTSPENRQSVAKKLGGYAVLVAAITSNDGGSGVPLFESSGGHFVLAFTDPSLFAQWTDCDIRQIGSGSAQTRPGCIIATLDEAVSMAIRSGADGLVINPLCENVVVPTVNRVTIPAGKQMAVGPPTEIPEHLRTSVVAALSGQSSVRRAYIVQILTPEEGNRLLLVLEGWAGSKVDYPAVIQSLGASLPQDETLDLVDQSTPLGGIAIQGAYPIVDRSLP